LRRKITPKTTSHSPLDISSKPATFPSMKSRPHCRLSSPSLAWICISGLLALSLRAVAAPPSLHPDVPVGIDNRQVAPQSLGTSTVAFTTSMEVLNDTAKLGAGDRVSFRIVEDRHEPITLVVTDSGEMEVPLIGRVKALDKTCKQLAYEIKPLFEKEYFQKATVIIGLDLVGTKSRGKVYLTGQVRAPGAIELMPGDPMTLSQAILRANGTADFADKRKVRLVRKKDGAPAATAEALKMEQPKKPGFFKSVGNMFRKEKTPPSDATETYIVDLVEILERGHLEKDPILKPGDLIFIPERLINF
jgi:protein involved in polysaccharide export with SLBB domain